MPTEVNGLCAIAVMAKASVAGRVKTRMVPPLTVDEAAEFNTAFLQDIALNLLNARVHAPIAPYMAFAPAHTERFFKENLPFGIGLLETVKPTFGECLRHAIVSLLEAGHTSVCVLNSDSPTLPVSYLISAATALSANGDRAVIGPSTDGGYYLLGLKRDHRRMFEDIAWSTEHVFDQTCKRAKEIGLDLVVLPTWYDVDEQATLRILCRELLDSIPFRRVGTDPTPAGASRALLRKLINDSDFVARLGLSASTAGPREQVA